MAEEGVEFPELLLLPVVERMVVALGALHLQAEEHASGRRSRLGPVLRVHFVNQKVDRAVEPFGTRFRRMPVAVTSSVTMVS